MSSKDAKEAFVTGHAGTAVHEVLLICLAAPLGVACAGNGKVREFTLMWLPMLVCQTKWLYPYGVILLGLQAGNLLILSRENRKEENEFSRRLPYLTMYRSSLLLLTFIAILAVDFHIFPRRFCKAEVDGYGLMDVGAASFIIAAGFVAKPGRKLNLKSIIPLLLLGMIRLLTTKGIEYQEHVSEYGVHWNFFFTLAAVNLMGSWIRIFHPKPNWYMPLLVMAAYQYWLTNWGGQRFIEDAPRTCESVNADLDVPWIIMASCNILAANREGIFGCLGYLALFQAAEWIGSVCLWNPRLSLARCAILMWALHFLTLMVQISVSRRSTNAGFCTWALAHNVTMLWSMKWVCTNTNVVVPPILGAINRHGLLMFVIANLLTGLVNVSVSTMDASDGAAMGYMTIYLVGVAAVALALDRILTKPPAHKTKDE